MPKLLIAVILLAIALSALAWLWWPGRTSGVVDPLRPLYRRGPREPEMVSAAVRGAPAAGAALILYHQGISGETANIARRIASRLSANGYEVTLDPVLSGRTHDVAPDLGLSVRDSDEAKDALVRKFVSGIAARESDGG